MASDGSSPLQDSIMGLDLGHVASEQVASSSHSVSPATSTFNMEDEYEKLSMMGTDELLLEQTATMGLFSSKSRPHSPQRTPREHRGAKPVSGANLGGSGTGRSDASDDPSVRASSSEVFGSISKLRDLLRSESKDPTAFSRALQQSRRARGLAPPTPRNPASMSPRSRFLIVTRRIRHFVAALQRLLHDALNPATHDFSRVLCFIGTHAHENLCMRPARVLAEFVQQDTINAIALARSSHLHVLLTTIEGFEEVYRPFNDDALCNNILVSLRCVASTRVGAEALRGFSCEVRLSALMSLWPQHIQDILILCANNVGDTNNLFPVAALEALLGECTVSPPVISNCAAVAAAVVRAAGVNLNSSLTNCLVTIATSALSSVTSSTVPSNISRDAKQLLAHGLSILEAVHSIEQCWHQVLPTTQLITSLIEVLSFPDAGESALAAEVLSSFPPNAFLREAINQKGDQLARHFINATATVAIAIAEMLLLVLSSIQNPSSDPLAPQLALDAALRQAISTAAESSAERHGDAYHKVSALCTVVLMRLATMTQNASLSEVVRIAHITESQTLPSEVIEKSLRTLHVLVGFRGGWAAVAVEVRQDEASKGLSLSSVLLRACRRLTAAPDPENVFVTAAAALRALADAPPESMCLAETDIPSLLSLAQGSLADAARESLVRAVVSLVKHSPSTHRSAAAALVSPSGSGGRPVTLVSILKSCTRDSSIGVVSAVCELVMCVQLQPFQELAIALSRTLVLFGSDTTMVSPLRAMASMALSDTQVSSVLRNHGVIGHVLLAAGAARLSPGVLAHIGLLISAAAADADRESLRHNPIAHHVFQVAAGDGGAAALSDSHHARVQVFWSSIQAEIDAEAASEAERRRQLGMLMSQLEDARKAAAASAAQCQELEGKLADKTNEVKQFSGIVEAAQTEASSAATAREAAVQEAVMLSCNIEEHVARTRISETAHEVLQEEYRVLAANFALLIASSPSVEKTGYPEASCPDVTPSASMLMLGVEAAESNERYDLLSEAAAGAFAFLIQAKSQLADLLHVEKADFSRQLQRTIEHHHGVLAHLNVVKAHTKTLRSSVSEMAHKFTSQLQLEATDVAGLRAVAERHRRDVEQAIAGERQHCNELRAQLAEQKQRNSEESAAQLEQLTTSTSVAMATVQKKLAQAEGAVSHERETRVACEAEIAALHEQVARLQEQTAAAESAVRTLQQKHQAKLSAALVAQHEAEAALQAAKAEASDQGGAQAEALASIQRQLDTKVAHIKDIAQDLASERRRCDALREAEGLAAKKATTLEAQLRDTEEAHREAEQRLVAAELEHKMRLMEVRRTCDEKMAILSHRFSAELAQQKALVSDQRQVAAKVGVELASAREAAEALRSELLAVRVDRESLLSTDTKKHVELMERLGAAEAGAKAAQADAAHERERYLRQNAHEAARFHLLHQAEGEKARSVLDEMQLLAEMALAFSADLHAHALGAALEEQRALQQQLAKCSAPTDVDRLRLALQDLTQKHDVSLRAQAALAKVNRELEGEVSVLHSRVEELTIRNGHLELALGEKEAAESDKADEASLLQKRIARLEADAHRTAVKLIASEEARQHATLELKRRDAAAEFARLAALPIETAINETATSSRALVPISLPEADLVAVSADRSGIDALPGPDGRHGAQGGVRSAGEQHRALRHKLLQQVREGHRLQLVPSKDAKDRYILDLLTALHALRQQCAHSITCGSGEGTSAAPGLDRAHPPPSQANQQWATQKAALVDSFKAALESQRRAYEAELAALRIKVEQLGDIVAAASAKGSANKQASELSAGEKPSSLVVARPRLTFADPFQLLSDDAPLSGPRATIPSKCRESRAGRHRLDLDRALREAWGNTDEAISPQPPSTAHRSSSARATHVPPQAAVPGKHVAKDGPNHRLAGPKEHPLAVASFSAPSPAAGVADTGEAPEEVAMVKPFVVPVVSRESTGLRYDARRDPHLKNFFKQRCRSASAANGKPTSLRSQHLTHTLLGASLKDA